MNQNRFLKASTTPLEDLELVTTSEQAAAMHTYKKNYEYYFDMLPILDSNDQLLSAKTQYSVDVMKKLGAQIVQDNWLEEKQQANGAFTRTIVAIASPTLNEDEGFKEGPEFLVAHWGKGFTSPVHGHAPGFEYEEILSGKIKVNMYRIIDAFKRIVRLVETKIVGKGTFVSEYIPKTNDIVRGELIHNFTALEPSHSLHFLNEHSRNGGDNAFTVEYFEDSYNLDEEDVKQISTMDAIYAPNGAVILVRSTNVAEYDDHYIVITGAPIMKPHGLRPQEIVIGAPHTNKLLDQYQMHTGVTLLRLLPHATDAFLDFHNIKVNGNDVLINDHSETISL